MHRVAGGLARSRAASISYPQSTHKPLDLARALAGDPTILLLDEIAGGLTEGEVTELIDTIMILRREGISIIWIEHIVRALLAVVDRICAINFGALLVEGLPNDVMCSTEVQACYLGNVAV